MRAAVTVFALAGLAACEPTIPDSGAGVGFNDYAEYQQERARREAELTGGAPLPSSQAISAETPTQAGAPLSALNAQGQATVTAAAAPAGTLPGAAPVASSALSEAPVAPGGQSALGAQPAVAPITAGELDAALGRAPAAQPRALSSTNSDGSPNIVAYALNTTNAVGQPAYVRDGGVSAEKLQRNCAKYGTSDQAQAAFLAAGGPQKDRHDIDPDGDGFACGWNPAPFRAARGG